jgi:hypothetical protein
MNPSTATLPPIFSSSDAGLPQPDLGRRNSTVTPLRARADGQPYPRDPLLESPVDSFSKLSLVVNRKTAEALVRTIPPSLLLRADEVIQ